jgi:transglutaminase-like putative cysteine protease
MTSSVPSSPTAEAMPDAAWRLRQAALALLVASALGSFVSSHGSYLAAWLLLPCAVSVWRPLPALPGWLRISVWQATRGLVAVTLLFALLWSANPTIADRTAQTVTHAAASGLAVLATLLLLGTRTWPPERGVVPAALGLLVATALRLVVASAPGPLPRLPYVATAAVAAVALIVYLVATQVGGARRLTAIAALVAAASALSAGIMLVLPWAQPRVEQALARTIGSGKSYSGLSSVSRLGDIEELALSRTVVMRVWTARPQKLRARVYTTFDGTAWQARPGSFHDLPPSSRPDFEAGTVDRTIPGRLFDADPQPASSSATVSTKIVQEIFNNGLLVTPVVPLRVRAPARLEMDDVGLVRAWGGAEVRVYGILNRPGATGDPASEHLTEALQLPDDVDPRLVKLAGELGPPDAGALQRIRRTVDFLRRQCSYSLKVGRFTSGQPIAEFVFEKRRGYCEYFASAAAVLLRLQGVPARYLTGFSVSDDSYQAGHYVVREGHAHAWIEAYVPEKGWIEVDPTPPPQYSATVAALRGGWIGDLVESVRGKLAALWATAGTGDWRATLRWVWATLLASWRLGLLAAIAVTGGISARRLFRRGWPARVSARHPEDVPAEPRELLRRLDRLWARRGLHRPPHRPPLEFLSRVPEDRLTDAERLLTHEVVEGCYRACFGGRTIPRDDLARWREALDRATRQPPG